MDLPSGKYSRAKMAIHSGFWVGGPVADTKQVNCRNFIVLQWNSGNLNHAKGKQNSTRPWRILIHPFNC
jgi:hypothetical protein